MPNTRSKEAREVGVGRGRWTRGTPRMVCISLRLPKDVRDFYLSPSGGHSEGMREVLTRYMMSQPEHTTRYTPPPPKAPELEVEQDT